MADTRSRKLKIKKTSTIPRLACITGNALLPLFVATRIRLSPKDSAFVFKKTAPKGSAKIGFIYKMDNCPYWYVIFVANTCYNIGRFAMVTVKLNENPGREILLFIMHWIYIALIRDALYLQRMNTYYGTIQCTDPIYSEKLLKLYVNFYVTSIYIQYTTIDCVNICSCEVMQYH